MDDAVRFLGLLYHGRAIVIGLDLENAINRGRIYGVLLSEDISEKAAGRIGALISAKNLPFVKCYTKEEIGASLGKGLITMVGFKSRKAYQAFISKVERSMTK